MAKWSERCEAPHCGAKVYGARQWALVRRYRPDLSSDPAPLTERDSEDDYVTCCPDDACRTWARLRAEELSDGYVWAQHQINASRTLYLPSPPQWYHDEKNAQRMAEWAGHAVAVASALVERADNDIDRRRAERKLAVSRARLATLDPAAPRR